MITLDAMTLAAMNPVYFIAPAGAIAALVTAFLFSRSVMARPEGDAEMIRIAQAVRDGAMAYLKRQYKVVFGVFILLIAFLAVMAMMGLQEMLTLIGVPIAGLFSGLCGWFGMKMATNASARTTAAVKESLNEGLTVAFRSGAVMGMVVVGFALLDASVWFFIFSNFTEFTVPVFTTIMLSFGMGASTQALFARVGGGIYTKAADVGADLVGKVEAGIPEDDARNPATIADNVGDHLGDVAGMGADLYESYYGSILATMALGAAAAMTLPGITNAQSGALAMLLALAPLTLAGAGIFCSIIGVFTVKAKEDATFAQLLKGLHKGVYVASGLIVICAFAILYTLLQTGAGKEIATAAGVSWLGLGGSILSGLIAGLVIAYATEYYTSYEHPPTRRISNQAITGAATVIISGIAEGMKSTWASILTVVIAIIAAFSFAGGGDNFLMGLYGVGIAAVGMLATLGITLATDAYGPIADNAGGNAEMTGQPPHVRERTDMLDSLGNTTAATGKGFAIGSAALTALALFAAYLQVVQIQLNDQATSYVNATTIEESAAGVAIHQGFGKYGLIFPGENGAEDTVSGAILVDKTQFDKIESSWRDIPVGDTFTVIQGQADDHDLTIAGGGLNFEIVSLNNGRIRDVLAFYDMTLTNPRVLGGIFIGVMLAFVFCAMTMNAVGRAANLMMVECRRQFGKMREGFLKNGMSKEDIADPMKWPKQIEHEGVHYPDYAACVSISTAGAQKEMVVPAVMAITVPIIVGLVLSVPGVVGMLVGGLTSGFAMAIFMANAGGAWDNAKKLIESYGSTTASEFANDPNKREAVPHEVRDDIDLRAQALIADGAGDTIVFGKGSDMHKATVVGDTVGDPFKDTSGPSLNILIKLISIVSVVFAGLIVKFGPYLGDMLGIN